MFWTLLKNVILFQFKVATVCNIIGVTQRNDGDKGCIYTIGSRNKGTDESMDISYGDTLGVEYYLKWTNDLKDPNKESNIKFIDSYSLDKLGDKSFFVEWHSFGPEGYNTQDLVIDFTYNKINYGKIPSKIHIQSSNKFCSADNLKKLAELTLSKFGVEGSVSNPIQTTYKP